MLDTLLVTVLLAQIGGPMPGQYPGAPYPGAPYPGGQGGGIPIPRRSKKTTQDQKSQADQPVVSATGFISAVGDKTLEIEATDTRILTYQLDDKTQKPAGLSVGDAVIVDAHEQQDGTLFAVSIQKTTLQRPTIQGQASAGRADAAAANSDVAEVQKPTELKGPKYDTGDDGPPTLKHGKPAQKRSEDDDAPAQSAAAPTPPPRAPQPPPGPAPAALDDPRTVLLEKAEEASEHFLEGLPNYVVQQNTTRYVSEGHPANWQVQDIITAEVVFEGGRERYQNLMVNGRPLKAKAEDSGAWSTGEFGTILADIFSPATAADFRFIKNTTINSFAASVYDFSVQQPNSHWQIQVPSQRVRPSYKGSIWVDKKTAHVLRIEMQATNIPKLFPEDTVESAVDYDYVSLGAAEKFLLPTRAEVLSCLRGTSQCSRNVIEFRNYHKFTGESKITFGQE
jgi:hypothetical protein